MIITLERGAESDRVKRALSGKGLWIEGVERSSDGTTSFVIGKGSTRVRPEDLEKLEGVARVSVAASPHPKVDAQGRRVVVGDAAIDPRSPVVIAGPCSVESSEQIERIASQLAASGVRFLRGGAFKPRTSPYAFQGRGPDALAWLRRAADKHGMKVVTEVLSELDVSIVAEHADVVQIGSRNMSNYALLKSVGRAGKPVMLKRSMSATVEEWLLAAEYLLSHGATGVVLCERGVRGFDASTRNLLDLGAVALLSHVHDLPVVVDPSHGTGRRELVLPLARAALGAGAAGVMIETHDAPDEAESDGAQALAPQQIKELGPWLQRAST
ncbi:MAG: 3-deoxy-7-phosphoheptulonate synthase [Polyangiaceae bacterium]